MMMMMMLHGRTVADLGVPPTPPISLVHYTNRPFRHTKVGIRNVSERTRRPASIHDTGAQRVMTGWPVPGDGENRTGRAAIIQHSGGWTQAAGVCERYESAAEQMSVLCVSKARTMTVTSAL